MAQRVGFVHVDVDNLWALAECYGVELAPGRESFIYEDALPRLGRLFEEFGIRATFFVVGRDLESPANLERLRHLGESGHEFSNHSYSHALNFRALSEAQIDSEISRTEVLLREKLGRTPQGFRAPGYGVSPALLRVLTRRGYRYDSSLMPSPYGFVFRFLDARMRRKSAHGQQMHKTQYSRLGEARAPLAPYPVAAEAPLRPSPGAPLFELPAATSPLLRLPFQAGVCMRLGKAYFRAQLAAFRRRPELPLLFLLHGADLADLRRIELPLFQRSAFFAQPVEEKLAALRYFLGEITSTYRIAAVEEWLGG
jgi:hypothetical protein